ncbi:hypothetical protein DBR06_SOUSAS610095, partial [Sousa chinensis]
EPSGPIILYLFGPSAFEGSSLDLSFPSPFEYIEEALDVSPGGVMGLKDSPNQIQKPLWIFPELFTMTFPVRQIRSGKWDVCLDEP